MNINSIWMESLLRGKCLPDDLLAGETLAEYLVRQLANLEQQLEESRREFTAANATIHNLELKVEQVVAENGRCKFEVSRCHQTVDEMFKNRDKWIDKEWLSAIWSTSKRLMDETPATDAYLAEVRAQGVDMFADATIKIGEEARSEDIVYAGKPALLFAAQLRQGAEHE